MARRTGSIDWKDGRWRIRIRYPDGKRDAIYVPDLAEPRLQGGRDTPAAIEAHRSAELTLVAALQHLAGTDHDPRLKSRTLGAWGIRWLNERELTHRDARGDRQRWGSYIAGTAIATMKLSAITTLHCQRWINDLAKHRSDRTGELLGRQTLSNALTTLRTCMRAAVRAELLEQNPAAGVELPPGRIDQVVENEEAIAFLELAELERIFRTPMTAAQRTALVIGLFVGLRPGEMHRLAWPDLNLRGDRPDVLVRRGKNGRAQRVPLLPPVVRVLRIWRALQLRCTPRLLRRPAGPVFPSPSLGNHHAGYDWGWAETTKGRAGLRARARIRPMVTWYDATRHTCATHLLLGTWLEAGWVPRALRIEEVSTWLRHSSTAVTERHYARFTADGLHDLLLGSRTRSAGSAMTRLLSHLRDLNPGPTVYESKKKLRAIDGLGERADPVELGLQVLEAQSRGEPPAPAAITTAIEALIVALREASAWRVRAGGA